MSQTTTYWFHNHDTLHVENCHGDHVKTKYPGGYVTGAFDATVTLETNGVPFDVNIMLNHDYTSIFSTLRIWDGDSTTGTLLVDTTCASLLQNIHISSGYLTARMQRADSSMM